MDALETIQSAAGAEPIEIGLILGSGLSQLGAAVDGVAVPYSQIPGFPYSGVSGHDPKIFVGALEGRRVAILGGRSHYYEAGDPNVMRKPIETLRALGAGTLLLTNAAGSFRPEVGPGELMLIADHINFSGLNPLIGESSDRRFVNMTDAYDPALRGSLRAAAEAEGVRLSEGVYAWYSGPSFETPAEIRAIRLLGADAVGMSTVPETILARFFGLRVAAVSVITNMGAGLSDEAISHDHTKANAPLGAAKFERVLRRFLRDGL